MPVLNLVSQMTSEHLGMLYFIVCSSDSAVFQAPATFSFSCATDSVFHTPASLPQVECCGHVVHGTAECQQCQLTWPESPCGVCPCKPSQQHRKAGFTPFLSDGGYHRLVHHHLYEIHLNLMGRILLKHWWISPTHLNFWRAMVQALQTDLLVLSWGLNSPHMLQVYG